MDGRNDSGAHGMRWLAFVVLTVAGRPPLRFDQNYVSAACRQPAVAYDDCPRGWVRHSCFSFMGYSKRVEELLIDGVDTGQFLELLLFQRGGLRDQCLGGGVLVRPQKLREG